MQSYSSSFLISATQQMSNVEALRSLENGSIKGNVSRVEKLSKQIPVVVY